MVMDISTFIILFVFEIVGVCVGVHLWFQKRRMKILPRILWSILLLVPFFGLLAFVFLRFDSDKNPDRMESTADIDAFYGGGGGHW